MGRITRRDFMRRAGASTALGYSTNVASAKAQTGEEPGSASSQTEGGHWTAHNETTEIEVNTRSGVIERLLDKLSGEDFCDQEISEPSWPKALARRFKVGPRIGGLILIDELQGKMFSDLVDPGQVRNVQSQTRQGSTSLSLEKAYPGAEFVVTETFRVFPDHIRWDISIRKTRGADRNIRVVQFAPLPVRDYEAWAPISEAPFPVEPYWPFAIDYGQSTMGSIGEERWRTAIPMMVFYSRTNNRALCFTSPIEVPAVRIRFLSNTGTEADFHYNSRRYPPRQRPYFQVSHEYLSVRNNKNLETGLLISAHPANWRPALGWVYSKYRKYFDADPSFYRWDGVYGSGHPFLNDSLTPEELQKDYAAMHKAGVRWEELHGHFPWYGLMIPPPDVKTWTCHSNHAPDTTLSRQKIEAHCKLARKNGIGTFLYYNVTESEHWYAQKDFSSSIAHSESGKPISAWRAQTFPSKRACFLMNSDPASAFGQHMIQQARAMVAAYPDAAGFFWDVFGRSYMFDFTHDDGITMVNNKPVYYPEFMYQRLMRDYIRPLLRSKGMLITANKPVTIASCEGVDGIMAYESAPEVENPPWTAAQSFLGLNRHVMIISRSPAHDPEMGFLQCLRYGMFYSYGGPVPGEQNEVPAAYIKEREDLARKYGPFIQHFRGKQWIFYPRALELPDYCDGNIFRLRDGRVMATMVSTWRQLRKVSGYAENLEVVCRLPDAAKMQSVRASAIDLGETWDLKVNRSGDTLKFVVPQHGKATAILLS
ncbi:MAG: hypothetical protein ACRD2B_09870 [Terriglobia bacterium]